MLKGVVPLVHKAPCSFKDCDEYGTYRPILKHPGRGDKPIELQLELLICDGCRLKSTIENFISNDGWDVIKKLVVQFGGNPKRKKVTIHFESTTGLVIPGGFQQ